MEEPEGIAYCPARVDPLTHVEVADFSNIHYLDLHSSEEEVDNKVDESEPEYQVNEGQSEPAIPRKYPSPTPSPVVKRKKARNEKPEKSAKPEPKESEPVKGTAAPLTGKKRRAVKKKEKEKERKQAKNKTNNAVKVMEPNAKSSEPSPPPTVEAVSEKSPPLPQPAEADKPENASPEPQLVDAESAATENKEAEADVQPDPKVEVSNEGGENKGLEKGAVPPADVTPTNDSSATPDIEQPDESKASGHPSAPSGEAKTSEESESTSSTAKSPDEAADEQTTVKGIPKTVEEAEGTTPDVAAPAVEPCDKSEVSNPLLVSSKDTAISKDSEGTPASTNNEAITEHTSEHTTAQVKPESAEEMRGTSPDNAASIEQDPNGPKTLESTPAPSNDSENLKEPEGAPAPTSDEIVAKKTAEVILEHAQGTDNTDIAASTVIEIDESKESQSPPAPLQGPETSKEPEAAPAPAKSEAVAEETSEQKATEFTSESVQETDGAATDSTEPAVGHSDEQEELASSPEPSNIPDGTSNSSESEAAAGQTDGQTETEVIPKPTQETGSTVTDNTAPATEKPSELETQESPPALVQKVEPAESPEEVATERTATEVTSEPAQDVSSTTVESTAAVEPSSDIAKDNTTEKEASTAIEQEESEVASQPTGEADVPPPTKPESKTSDEESHGQEAPEPTQKSALATEISESLETEKLNVATGEEGSTNAKIDAAADVPPSNDEASAAAEKSQDQVITEEVKTVKTASSQPAHVNDETTGAVAEADNEPTAAEVKPEDTVKPEERKAPVRDAETSEQQDSVPDSQEPQEGSQPKSEPISQEKPEQTPVQQESEATLELSHSEPPAEPLAEKPAEKPEAVHEQEQEQDEPKALVDNIETPPQQEPIQESHEPQEESQTDPEEKFRHTLEQQGPEVPTNDAEASQEQALKQREEVQTQEEQQPQKEPTQADLPHEDPNDGRTAETPAPGVSDTGKESQGETVEKETTPAADAAVVLESQTEEANDEVVAKPVESIAQSEEQTAKLTEPEAQTIEEPSTAEPEQSNDSKATDVPETENKGAGKSTAELPVPTSEDKTEDSAEPQDTDEKSTPKTEPDVGVPSQANEPPDEQNTGDGTLENIGSEEKTLMGTQAESKQVDQVDSSEGGQTGEAVSTADVAKATTDTSLANAAEENPKNPEDVPIQEAGSSGDGSAVKDAAPTTDEKVDEIPNATNVEAASLAVKESIPVQELTPTTDTASREQPATSEKSVPKEQSTQSQPPVSTDVSDQPEVTQAQDSHEEKHDATPAESAIETQVPRGESDSQEQAAVPSQGETSSPPDTAKDKADQPIATDSSPPSDEAAEQPAAQTSEETVQEPVAISIADSTEKPATKPESVPISESVDGPVQDSIPEATPPEVPKTSEDAQPGSQATETEDKPSSGSPPTVTESATAEPEITPATEEVPTKAEPAQTEDKASTEIDTSSTAGEEAAVPLTSDSAQIEAPVSEEHAQTQQQGPTDDQPEPATESVANATAPENPAPNTENENAEEKPRDNEAVTAEGTPTADESQPLATLKPDVPAAAEPEQIAVEPEVVPTTKGTPAKEISAIEEAATTEKAAAAEGAPAVKLESVSMEGGEDTTGKSQIIEDSKSPVTLEPEGHVTHPAEDSPAENLSTNDDFVVIEKADADASNEATDNAEQGETQDEEPTKKDVEVPTEQKPTTPPSEPSPEQLTLEEQTEHKVTSGEDHVDKKDSVAPIDSQEFEENDNRVTDEASKLESQGDDTSTTPKELTAQKDAEDQVDSGDNETKDEPLAEVSPRNELDNVQQSSDEAVPTDHQGVDAQMPVETAVVQESTTHDEPEASPVPSDQDILTTGGDTTGVQEGDHHDANNTCGDVHAKESAETLHSNDTMPRDQEQNAVEESTPDQDAPAVIEKEIGQGDDAASHSEKAEKDTPEPAPTDTSIIDAPVDAPVDAPIDTSADKARQVEPEAQPHVPSEAPQEEEISSQSVSETAIPTKSSDDEVAQELDGSNAVHTSSKELETSPEPLSQPTEKKEVNDALTTTEESPNQAQHTVVAESLDQNQDSDSKDLTPEQEPETPHPQVHNALEDAAKPDDISPTSTTPEKGKGASENKDQGETGEIASGIVAVTAIAVANQVLAHQQPTETDKRETTSDHPLDTTEVVAEKPSEPEPIVAPPSPKAIHKPPCEAVISGIECPEKPVSPLPGDDGKTSSSEKQIIGEEENVLPQATEQVNLADVTIVETPRDISGPSVKGDAPDNSAEIAEPKPESARTATPEPPKITEPTMPAPESVTVAKDSIPQKSSKRSLRPTLVNSSTQTEDDFKIGPRPDDEEKKSADERRHRHRRSHRDHHHSSQSRDIKNSGENIRHRKESNLSVKSTSDRSSAQPPKRHDSGLTLESSQSFSSRKHRAERTPEEQAAHERRKERRASREVFEKTRESKGKDPEAPPSDRHSHRSSRRHSLSHSEKSHSKRQSERSFSERVSERQSERSHSDRHSEKSQSERHSTKEEGSSPKKKFFDILQVDLKNVESVLAPNHVPVTTGTSGSSSYTKDTSKSGTLKRSSTTKSHREPEDMARPKSHRSHEESPKSHRSHDESSKRRRAETKSGAEPEPSSSKVSVPKDEHKHSRREERQKARDAREAEASKKPAGGIRAAFKKIFS